MLLVLLNYIILALRLFGIFNGFFQTIEDVFSCNLFMLNGLIRQVEN